MLGVQRVLAYLVKMLRIRILRVRGSWVTLVFLRYYCYNGVFSLVDSIQLFILQKWLLLGT